MDIRKVKKLIELLEESNIGEIEIKEGEESVRISRHVISPRACGLRRTRACCTGSRSGTRRCPC